MLSKTNDTEVQSKWNKKSQPKSLLRHKIKNCTISHQNSYKTWTFPSFEPWEIQPKRYWLSCICMHDFIEFNMPEQVFPSFCGFLLSLGVPLILMVPSPTKLIEFIYVLKFFWCNGNRMIKKCERHNHKKKMWKARKAEVKNR